MISENARIRSILREKAFEAALSVDGLDAKSTLESAKRFYEFLVADMDV